MTRYIGGDYHFTGSTSLTLNSTNITHSKAYTAAAYNCATIKNSSNQTKYIHTVYISKPTVRKIGSTEILYGYHWHPIKKGYIYNSQGPLQFWDRPSGIPGLLNVAIMKNSPHTMVVALFNNSYTKANLVKVTPTGLGDLVTPLAIHIAGFGAYGDGKIVVIGIDSANRVACYDCNNTDYRFDKIWTNDEVYNTQPINAFMQSHWAYGYETYSSPGNTSSYWRYSSVSFAVPNRDIGGVVKIIQYTYDADVDTYYWNISRYDKATYLWGVRGCNQFTSSGGALQNCFRWQPSCNPTYGADREYNNRTLGGAQYYVNRFLGSISDSDGLFISCTYTPSGGSTTGYTFMSKDQGATWTQKYYGDNCYRICKQNPMGYYWAVGYSSANYIRSLWMPSDSNWYSSKVTFPTSTMYSNRIQIPGDAFVLRNSSDVYLIDYEKMIGGQDQTVSTTPLTDPSGNAFAIKDACWNANMNNSDMAYKQSHTFYVSTNDANGLIMSETWVQASSFQKELIEVGGPVLLMTDNT